jgi:hypothetical protein
MLVLSVAGCGMHLKPDASGSNSSIAGQWQLQSPSRAVLADNLRTVMDEAWGKQDKRDQQQYRRRPDSDVNLAPPDADDADHPPSARDLRHPKWEARERLDKRDALLNAILPADKLQIVQSENRIEFIPSPGARRRFDKGERSALVTSYADLRVESGWQANVFVVHSRDSEQGINIVERYQRNGDRLRMQVELSIPDAKGQMFAAEYSLSKP